MQNEIERKMENVITVFALETCDKCNQLKGELDRNGIQYHYVNVSKNDQLGDILEETYKCTSYPIVAKGAITFLPYTSLSNTRNIKIFNSIDELIKMLN